eukprot:TRINITY_DN2643_c0_g1_i3.p1 TRINITY_DN2643_c0_g1~~TRINITY_DN2643_c0_g1_i3.p1  ORF type:complete len:223 (+),score=47.90 TRINITY_DN2643_c0_g1_i3:151-819(+)
MLLAGGLDWSCSEEVLTIAALLSVQSIWSANHDTRAIDASRRRFAVTEGDLLTNLNAFNAYLRQGQSAEWCSQHHLNSRILSRVVQVRAQLKKYMHKYKIAMISANGNSVNIRKAILSGFFANAAHRNPDGTYLTISDKQVLHMHPGSVVYHKNPEWIIYHEVVWTGRFQMRDITVIDPLWLSEIAPHYYQYSGLDQRHKLEVESQHQDNEREAGYRTTPAF